MYQRTAYEGTDMKRKPKRQHRNDAVAREVGEHLRGVRIRLGLTQEELASSSGHTRAGISQIEVGAITPSVTTLYLLAHAMGLRVRDLLPVGAP